MATPEEIKLQTEGIQNSEKLLDLTNQVNDAITERKKILKGLNAEEQLYFTTVKQQQKLSQDIAANAEKYLGYQIKSKDLAKQIKATKDNQAKTELAFNTSINGQASLAEKLEKQRQEVLQKAFNTRKQIRQQIDLINKLDEKNQNLQILKNEAERNGNINLAKQIQTQIRENQRIANNKEKYVKTLETQFDKEKNLAKTARETIENGKKILEDQKKEIAFLEENERIRKRIEKSTGLLGAFSKSLAKIPGIGQYLNADEAIAEMEKLAAEIEEAGGKATSFSNRLQIGLKGLSTLAKGFYENIKSPEAVFTFIVTKAFQANKQVVELGKSLGYGVGRADDFREKLVDIERASNNLNVNTTNLVEAFGQLAQATGLSYEFTADQLETQIKLTKQVGLQANEAAQIQRFAIVTGKTSEETYKSFVRGLTTARNQLRVGIDFKAALAEAAKVSGQLAANLGNNPETIAKAVVTAKAFGMTLEQVAAAGDKLLDFTSSIESELKAELLLGKEINLERARAAALAGDQVTLAEELSKNVGTAAEFTKLNRLQQNALAESVGMTSDALAETLRKREEAIASGKSLAQVTAEEAAEALERQTIQDKFNAAMLKLQDLIGNIVAGPLGSFIDILSGALNIVNKIGNAIGFLATPLKIIGGIYAGLVIAEKTILGYQSAKAAISARELIVNRANYAVKAAQMGTEAFITREKGVQQLMDKQGLASRVLYNAQLLIGLIREQGVSGIKTYVSTLDEKSLARKIIMNVYDKASFVLQRGTAALAAFRAAAEKSIILSYIKQGALMLVNLGRAIATAVAQISGASAATLGIAAGIALAAGAAAYAFLGSKKGDDVLSEGDGYGKRTLLSPEGTIRLNDKDTVIAGTNLGGGDNDKITKISQEATQIKNNESQVMPQIDLTPMIAAINEVKAAVDRLYSKDTSINMDGKKVGTTLVQNSYKVS